MSFIPDDSAEVTIQFQIGGGDHFSYCVFGVANPDEQTAQYIAQNVGVDFDESLMPLLCDATAIRSIKAVLGTGQFYIDNEAYSGDQATPQMPPQVAYLMKKQTDNIGRSNRGRMYLPGVEEAQVSNTGAVAGARQDALTAAGNTFLGKLTADAIPMIILHADPAITDNPLVDRFECDAFVATQRRRLR